MKTKTFLLICLFLGIGLAQLSAQFPEPPEGTKSIVYTFTLEWPYMEYVNCNGVEDILTGWVSLKETDLYKNGVVIKGNAIIYGELKSGNDGEVFRYKDATKGWGDLDQNGVFLNMDWHSNIVGENGTHYIVFYSYRSGVITINKITCPENKGK